MLRVRIKMAAMHIHTVRLTSIYLPQNQKRDSGNDREKGEAADINKGNKCDEGTKHCARKRNLQKLPKIAENGRAQIITRETRPPPNCKKTQNRKAQKITREKKTYKNCQKSLKQRAQKITRETKLPKNLQKIAELEGT
jgi:hypothetical protein